jgi:hypothetical protein
MAGRLQFAFFNELVEYSTNKMKSSSQEEFVKFVKQSILSTTDYGSKQYIDTLLEDCSNKKNTKELIHDELIVPLSMTIEYLKAPSSEFVSRSELLSFSIVHFKLISAVARNVVYRSAFHEAVPELVQLLMEYVEIVNMELPVTETIEVLKVEMLRFFFRVLQSYQQSLSTELLNRFLSNFVYRQFELVQSRSQEAAYEHETMMMTIALCSVLCSHPELSTRINTSITILHHICKLFTVNEQIKIINDHAEFIECTQLLAHAAQVNIPVKKSYKFGKVVDQDAILTRDQTTIDTALFEQTIDIFSKYIEHNRTTISETEGLETIGYALVYLAGVLNQTGTENEHLKMSDKVSQILYNSIRYLIDLKASKTSRTFILSVLKVLRKHLQYNKVSTTIIEEKIYPLVTEIYDEAVTSNKSVYKSKAHSAIIKILCALLCQETITSEQKHQELLDQIFANDTQLTKLLLVQRASLAVAQAQLDTSIIQSLVTDAFIKLMEPIQSLVTNKKTHMSRTEVSRLFNYADSLINVTNKFNPALVRPSIQQLSDCILFLLTNCTVSVGYSCIEAYVTLCKSLNREELTLAHFNEITEFINNVLLNGLQQQDSIKLKHDKKSKNASLDIESELFLASLEFIETMAKHSEAFKSDSDTITKFIHSCTERVKKPITFELDEDERIYEAKILVQLVNLTVSGSLSQQEKIKCAGEATSNLLQALMVHMRAFELGAGVSISEELVQLLSSHSTLLKPFVTSLPDARRKLLAKIPRQLTDITVGMKIDMETTGEDEDEEEEEEEENNESTAGGEELTEEEMIAKLDTNVKQLQQLLIQMTS